MPEGSFTCSYATWLSNSVSGEGTIPTTSPTARDPPWSTGKTNSLHRGSLAACPMSYVPCVLTGLLWKVNAHAYLSTHSGSLLNMGITRNFSFRTLVSPPAQHLGVCSQSTRALQAHAGCCNSPLSLPHRAGRPTVLLAMAGPWAPVTVKAGLRPYSTERAKRDEEH